MLPRQALFQRVIFDVTNGAARIRRGVEKHLPLADGPGRRHSPGALAHARPGVNALLGKAAGGRALEVLRHFFHRVSVPGRDQMHVLGQD